MRKILSKRESIHKFDLKDPEDQLHSYGWKLYQYSYRVSCFC